jgi:CRP/FNR family transcriptional regulator, cyclic AMP receptor protein
VLRDNALFSGVEGAALARVLSVFRTATVPAGAVLYLSGHRARRVFLIVAGSVAVTQRTGTVETLVAVLGPGEFTGERALLHPATRHVWSAAAREETRVAFADADVLLAALTAYPALGVNIAAGLHRRVRDAALAIDGLIAAR